MTTPTRSTTILDEGGIGRDLAKRQLVFRYDTTATTDDDGAVIFSVPQYHEIDIQELNSDQLMKQFNSLDDLVNMIGEIQETPDLIIEINDGAELNDAMNKESFLSGERIIMIKDVKSAKIAGFSHDIPTKRSFYNVVKEITKKIKVENQHMPIKLRTYSDKVSLKIHIFI